MMNASWLMLKAAADLATESVKAGRIAGLKEAAEIVSHLDATTKHDVTSDEYAAAIRARISEMENPLTPTERRENE